MRIEWDEDKRQSNLRKHGYDFAGVEELFDGITITVEDRKDDYGEQRFSTLGLLRDRVVVVIHTEDEDHIRVISIRKALKHEQRAYFAEIPD